MRGSALPTERFGKPTFLTVYSTAPATNDTILDLAATLGVDYIILGSSQRSTLADLLRGSVSTQIMGNAVCANDEGMQ